MTYKAKHIDCFDDMISVRLDDGKDYIVGVYDNEIYINTGLGLRCKQIGNHSATDWAETPKYGVQLVRYGDVFISEKGIMRYAKWRSQAEVTKKIENLLTKAKEQREPQVILCTRMNTESIMSDSLFPDELDKAKDERIAQLEKRLAIYEKKEEIERLERQLSEAKVALGNLQTS